MSSQRLRQQEIDPRKSRRQPVPRRRQVAADVDAGRQEVGEQHHALGAAPHAARAAFLDIRLRQLQKGRLDQRMAAALQAFGDVIQVGVGLRLPAAVCD